MSSNLLCRTVFWYSLITCACHLLLSVIKTLFPLHRAILFVNKLIYATAKRDNKKTGKSDNWKFKRNDRKTVHMRCRLIEWYQFYYSFLYVCLTLRFSSFSSTSYCCLYSAGSVVFSSLDSTFECMMLKSESMCTLFKAIYVRYRLFYLNSFVWHAIDNVISSNETWRRLHFP